jgi:MFS family permease
MHMPAELGLTGQQPNIALAIFFVPYIAFEIPSNILMKKLTPRIWLPICILGFGVAMLGQGFVKNYSGLLATCFFLGLAEAGIFPGSFYLISFWYRREESQKRFTVYWCSVIFASMFGGLLATGIAHMDGTGGYSNWRWIFILEGLATIVVGFASFFLITNFPEQAKWLTPAEREYVLAGERTSFETSITLGDIAEFFKDIKNYLGAVMYFCKPRFCQQSR